MAKYKGAYRDELEKEEDLTYAQELELERKAEPELQAKDPEEIHIKSVTAIYADIRNN